MEPKNYEEIQKFMKERESIVSHIDQLCKAGQGLSDTAAKRTSITITAGLRNEIELWINDPELDHVAKEFINSLIRHYENKRNLLDDKLKKL